MAANTLVRIASVSAAAYAVLVASGPVTRFAHSGRLSHLGDPGVWIPVLVAVLAAWGLWKHYAWAWWLALAGAAWQLFRIASWYVQGPLGRVPGTYILIAVALLAVVLVALPQRRARLACSR